MGRVFFMVAAKALVPAVIGCLVLALSPRGFLATTWAKLFQLS
jgi:hypothetical protein